MAKANLSEKRINKNPAETVEVSWSLAELPSPQHRAGLAGLAMMVDYACRFPRAPDAVIETLKLDENSFKLRINWKGLETLLDRTYAADLVEEESRKLRKDKNKNEIEPIARRMKEIKDKKGNPKAIEVFIYEIVRPQGAMLAELSPSGDEGRWIKLWRDWLWNTLRARSKQRNPYERRAQNLTSIGEAEHDEPDSTGCASAANDLDTAWSLLIRDKPVSQASTYYLGAMEANAENVPFQDRGRFLFLLHFWPFTVQIFIPRTMDWEGKTESDFNSYTVCIPDVCNLVGFTRTHEMVLKQRSPEPADFRPAIAYVDLPEAAALETDRWFARQLSGKLTGRTVTAGFQVIHTTKAGNNVNIKSVRYLEPTRKMREDSAIVNELWHPAIRRLILENALDNRMPDRWWWGAARLCATLSKNCTISSVAFKHDVRILFEKFHPNLGKENTMSENEREPRCLETLVLHMVTTWISARLESKYQLTWESVKDKPDKKKEYEEKKSKLALDAFLAARSRPGRDFERWFTATLCSVNHRMTDKEFLLFSKALDQSPDQVRTITLLALSARG